MPSSTTPGSSDMDKFQSSHVDIGLRRDLSGSALPTIPQSVSRGKPITRLPGSLICYGLPVCSPSCTDPTGFPTVEDLYFQAFNELGPLLDMTTTVTGLLVWGLFCQGGSTRGLSHFFYLSFFVRLESPFLRPDPHDRHAGARRSSQGWPPLWRPPQGLALTAPSTTARLGVSG